jgi:hypothetical protein
MEGSEKRKGLYGIEWASSDLSRSPNDAVTLTVSAATTAYVIAPTATTGTHTSSITNSPQASGGDSVSSASIATCIPPGTQEVEAIPAPTLLDSTPVAKLSVIEPNRNTT